MIKYDRIEENYIEKDELVKKYEEENQSLQESLKIMQMQLEEYGDQHSNIIGSLNNERQQ